MLTKLCLFLIVLVVFTSLNSSAQTDNDTITRKSAERIITYLASDELKGRVNYSKEQLQAAEFISNEFLSYGLKPCTGFSNFYQPFYPSYRGKKVMMDVKWNDKNLNDSLYYFFSRSLSPGSLDLSSFTVLQTFSPLASSVLEANWQRKDDLLIQIILSDSLSFSEAIKDLQLPAGMPGSNILIAGAKEEPVNVKLTPNKKMLNSTLYNIAGMLPGRTLPNEIIIFSAHYDHIDRGLTGEFGGLYNGANDNASGTTAVMELANYFAKRNDNERTIVFCLFAGEEIGLLGSHAFLDLIKPETIKAVINIEMIGITNIGGKNSCMLTGSSYSSLYSILKQNLQGDKVQLLEQRSDPTNLFGRSDNYSFASEGIPAHSIMGSNDSEPCYHKTCDDVKRIDLENMTRIIKAIAKSATTLISGKDTPTRIKGF